MKVIWKFTFDVVDSFAMVMPNGAEILTVQVQNETPSLWAIVDPDMTVEQRHFRIYGTGHPIYSIEFSTQKFIGTFQLHGGHFVGHLFEDLAAKDV